MIIYHMHHIIPKHMGGSNEKSNLIKLTVQEHAEAHRKLWEEHNKQEDYIAWKALSGQMSMDQAKIEARKIGQKRGTEVAATRPNVGGHALRNQQKGIHDPNKKYLKSKGGKVTAERGHIKKFTKASKWMTNGKDDTRALQEKQEQLLKEGWVFGRTFSPNKGKPSPLKGTKRT